MSIPTPQEYALPDQPEQEIFKLGTVTALFSNGAAKVRFDGEEAASEKQYKYLKSYSPLAGERVLLAVVSGTYVILGSIK